MNLSQRFIILLTLGTASIATAQDDSSSTSVSTSQDGIYSNRPFIKSDRRIAIGGYVEGNTNYFVEDGLTDGFSMELRRFNVFLFSAISPRVRFLSELEFEHGTEEIALETALLDFKVDPALNFRAGILLPPIGQFNQNHDSPLWEFVDRPLVSTTIIPATLSEVGFGLFGKFYRSQFIFTYDLYLTNGLQDNVILNADGRTSTAAGKSPEMFAEDNNGRPMYTGKIAARHRSIGELGLSFYGGTYNTFRQDGTTVDEKRNLWIFAVDGSFQVKKLSITGEYAYNTVEVPSDVTEIFGRRQSGAFIDFVYPVLQKKLLRFEQTIVNANLRLEAVDYNHGTFSSTGQHIGDEVKAISIGGSLRPNKSTVIKAVYQYQWINDILRNPTTKRAGLQIGVASYF